LRTDSVSPDDYDEITNEWWESISNNGARFLSLRHDFFLYFDGRLFLEAESKDKMATHYVLPLPNVKTRGDVRRLLKALE
jgi:hypothetical protein